MSIAWAHDPVLLVIYALASFRVTRLWISDTLPPLPLIRARIEAAINARQARQHRRKREAGHAFTQAELMRRPALHALLDCYWCAGFWISAAAALIASTPAEPYLRPVAVALAFSAVVGVLASRIDD